MSGLFGEPADGPAEAALLGDLKRAAEGIARPQEPTWEGSSFRSFKAGSPTVTGSMFERLVSAWLALQSVRVSPRTDSGHDRRVNGRKVEIKGATICPSGAFIFNQIRDQDYDYAVLLGLLPHRACMWVEEKGELRRLGRNQHASEETTKMLSVRPGWLGPRSDGSLSVAIREIRALS